MNNYIFETTATMKEYNREKYWIDADIIGKIRLTAANVKEALNRYREIIAEKYYVSISDNAIKNKSKMYVDTVNGETKQVGYVITGQTEIEEDYYKWTKQYIDLWVTIQTVVDTDFED